MGMYDTFKGICPSCGHEFESQTKITAHPRLRDITVGTEVHLPDMRLQLKSPCNCGQDVVAVFKGHKLVALETGSPTAVEGRWGVIHDPATAEEDEQRNVDTFFQKVNDAVDKSMAKKNHKN